jgi:hypothetical protein
MMCCIITVELYLGERPFSPFINSQKIAMQSSKSRILAILGYRLGYRL